MKRIYCIFERDPRAACLELEWSTDKDFCLDRVEVEPTFWGRGYARKLLDEVLHDADAEQVTLYLEVRPLKLRSCSGLSYEALDAWYKRHGFSEDGDWFRSRGLNENLSTGWLVRHPRGIPEMNHSQGAHKLEGAGQ